MNNWLRCDLPIGTVVKYNYGDVCGTSPMDPILLSIYPPGNTLRGVSVPYYLSHGSKRGTPPSCRGCKKKIPRNLIRIQVVGLVSPYPGKECYSSSK
jgi:hypothetical protein